MSKLINYSVTAKAQGKTIKFNVMLEPEKLKEALKNNSLTDDKELKIIKIECDKRYL